MRPRTIMLASAVVAVLALLAGRAAPAASPACTGGDLRGVFAVVPGSAGAGNIVYDLRLTNRSTRTCFVTGIPGLRLLGLHGQALPTHVVPAFRGALTAVLVVLRPGASAVASARFSPDVPGPGEGGRRCEPVAHTLRVSPRAGGSLLAAIRPPTPVCEHGQLQLAALSHARATSMLRISPGLRPKGQ